MPICPLVLTEATKLSLVVNYRAFMHQPNEGWRRYNIQYLHPDQCYIFRWVLSIFVMVYMTHLSISFRVILLGLRQLYRVHIFIFGSAQMFPYWHTQVCFRRNVKCVIHVKLTPCHIVKQPSVSSALKSWLMKGLYLNSQYCVCEIFCHIRHHA